MSYWNEGKKISSFSDFESWRNKQIKQYEMFCNSLDYNDLPDKDKLKEEFRDFPNCMIQLTKQICKCDHDCLINSFFNINFDAKCLGVNIDALFVSNVHRECSKYGVKFVNGMIFSTDEVVPFTRAGLRLKDSMQELCDGNNDLFKDIQCNMYELNDECSNDLKCIKSNLYTDLPTDCRNNDLKYQIDEINNLIGLPIFNITLISKPNNEDKGPLLKILFKRFDEKDTASILDTTEPQSIFEDNVMSIYEDDVMSIKSELDIKFSSVFVITGILISIIGYFIYKISSRKTRISNDPPKREIYVINDC